MDCTEFRRQTQVDPLARSASLQAHEDACADCALFARAARASEIRLRALMREVVPPAGLADRIRCAAHEQRQRWRYTAAFGLLLMIAVSMVLIQRSSVAPAQPALVSAVLAHIAAEPHHLQQDSRVSANSVDWLFARFGARLTETLGQVIFAGECLMRTRTGVHLVLPGTAGPVTVFFMPGESTDRVLPVASEELIGSIMPTGWGSVAVVGGRGEDIVGFWDRISDAVDWPANG